MCWNFVLAGTIAKWEVARRFNDFKKLRKDLTARGLKPLPPLPSSGFLSFEHELSETFLDTRKEVCWLCPGNQSTRRLCSSLGFSTPLPVNLSVSLPATTCRAVSPALSCAKDPPLAPQGLLEFIKGIFDAHPSATQEHDVLAAFFNLKETVRTAKDQYTKVTRARKKQAEKRQKEAEEQRRRAGRSAAIARGAASGLDPLSAMMAAE